MMNPENRTPVLVSYKYFIFFTQKDSRNPKSGSDVSPESQAQDNAGSRIASETGTRIGFPGNRMGNDPETINSENPDALPHMYFKYFFTQK
jgi:hypothetical protein